MEAPEVSENIPEKSYLIKKVGDLKVLPFVARKMLDTMGDEKSDKPPTCIDDTGFKNDKKSCTVSINTISLQEIRHD
jgi:hypothetical protein